MVERLRLEEPGHNELPKPDEGACGEIFFEILTDRQEFHRKVLTVLKEENPFLLDVVINTSIACSDREMSLDWSLTYYELFSRSTRKAGVKMPQVANETVASHYERRSLGSELAKERGEQAAEKYGKSLNDLVERMTIEDMKKSYELGRFWTMVARYTASAKFAGKNTTEIFDILHSLHEVQALLHSQANAK